MNAFRLVGDLVHVSGALTLLWKISSSRSCAGVSLKTQQMYALVYVTRYLDIFWNFNSTYNLVMKLVYLASSFATVHYVTKYRHSLDSEADGAFRTPWVVVPSLVLALISQARALIYVPEAVWAFSIFLEALAVLPQLVLLRRRALLVDAAPIAPSVFLCIVALGGYRGLYILGWIYRAASESTFHPWFVYIAGFVQTALNLTMLVTWYMNTHASGEPDVSKSWVKDRATDAMLLDVVKSQQQQESQLGAFEGSSES